MKLLKSNQHGLSNQAVIIVCLKDFSGSPAYEDPWLVSFTLGLVCCSYTWTVAEVNELQNGMDPSGHQPYHKPRTLFEAAGPSLVSPKCLPGEELLGIGAATAAAVLCCLGDGLWGNKNEVGGVPVALEVGRIISYWCAAAQQ